MANTNKRTSPSLGSNHLDDKTSKKRAGIIPLGSDIQTQMAAISAQKKKEEEQEDEALIKAKAKIDKAVKQKNLPESTGNDTA